MADLQGSVTPDLYGTGPFTAAWNPAAAPGPSTVLRLVRTVREAVEVYSTGWRRAFRSSRSACRAFLERRREGTPQACASTLIL